MVAIGSRIVIDKVPFLFVRLIKTEEVLIFEFDGRSAGQLRRGQ